MLICSNGSFVCTFHTHVRKHVPRSFIYHLWGTDWFGVKPNHRMNALKWFDPRSHESKAKPGVRPNRAQGAAVPG